MAVHPDGGAIRQNQHGEQDGDEISVLDIHNGAAGSNYGRPVTTYGVDYGDGSEIGDLPPERPLPKIVRGLQIMRMTYTLEASPSSGDSPSTSGDGDRASVYRIHPFEALRFSMSSP